MPVAAVASIRPADPINVSRALARTASSGGKRPLNATTSGTHVPAASPVIARPINSPLASWAVPISQAPSPAKPNPTRMNGLRRPSQSATMPKGKRMIACHSPYMARITPTSARSWVFP